MKIRKISLNYLDKIVEISKEQFKEESWTFDQFKDALNDKNYCCYGVHDEDNELMSYCLVVNSMDDINILSLATSNQHKNKGLATRLIEYVINQAKNEHKTVSLEVKETNVDALKLYLKLNFTVMSKRENYYKDGKTAFVMFFDGNNIL